MSSPNDPWAEAINELMGDGESPLIRSTNALLASNPDISDDEFEDALTALCEVPDEVAGQ